MNVVSDSDIIIDWLNGVPDARDALREYERIFVSIITWMEVLVGARTPEAEAETRTALEAVEVVGLSPVIAEAAVVIRRASRLRVPDAVILATSRTLGLPLLTRNTRDFDASDPSIRVPYTL